MADKDEENENKLGLTPELQKKYDDILFEFGIKMHTGRKRYKLTQEDIAEAVNLKPGSGKHRISLIENGRVPLKLPFMMRIADLFGMELQLNWVPKKKVEPRKKAKNKDDTEPGSSASENDEDKSQQQISGLK